VGAGLDDVGVGGALGDEVGLSFESLRMSGLDGLRMSGFWEEAVGFLLEDADERLADDLALAFGRGR